MASSAKVGNSVCAEGRRVWVWAVVTCLLLTGPVRGQQSSDLLGWAAGAVRVQPDSACWAIDISYQYIAAENISRTFLRFGTVHMTYFLPKNSLSLSAGYVVGPVDRAGWLHVTQVRFSQMLTAPSLRPRWQLTLDRLWLTPPRYDNVFRKPVYRVRYLAGIRPHLTKQMDLILTTEPFLYRTPGWFQEVRSQAGVQWQFGHHLTVQLLYANFWRGYQPARVMWEHSVLLSAVVLLDGKP